MDSQLDDPGVNYRKNYFEIMFDPVLRGSFEDHGVDLVDYLNILDADKQTILVHILSRCSTFDPEEIIYFVKKCINAGLDPNDFDSHGRSILHLCIQLGLEELVRFLLEKGADVNSHVCVETFFERTLMHDIKHEENKFRAATYHHGHFAHATIYENASSKPGEDHFYEFVEKLPKGISDDDDVIQALQEINPTLFSLLCYSFPIK